MSGTDQRLLTEATLAAITRRLDPEARLLASHTLEGGVSATMTALDVDRRGRRQTVIVRLPGPANLKADPESATHEFRLLGLLAEHGIPAPRPLLLDTARDLVAMDYLVLGWLEGAVDFAPADPIAAAEAMAALLARVHAIPATPDLGFLPMVDDPLALQEAGLADDHPARLDAAGVRHAELARAEALPAGFVLLHGDFWPGNMLWRDGALAAALDWEDAATGDPLSDVAIARLDLAIFFGLDAADAFAARYSRETGHDLAALPLWDLYACQRGPVDYGAWGDSWAEEGRPDLDAAAMEAGRSAMLQRARTALGLPRL